MLQHSYSHYLHEELNFLAIFIKKRLLSYFNKEKANFQIDSLSVSNGQVLPVYSFCTQHNLNVEEYLIVLMALAPHLQPDFYDNIIQSSIEEAGDFPLLGGIRGKNHRGFLPTGFTVLFLLGVNNLPKRIEVEQYFRPDHFFFKHRILWLELPIDNEPRLSGQLVLSDEYYDLFTTGQISPPAFGPGFPAKQLQTTMAWEDLVLPAKTLNQIEEIKIWVKHQHTLMEDWGMKRKLKPGYKALFYGLPGTGKTLTAALIGQYCEKLVFKIDLSLIVSKYIGETEKNLSKLFDKATNKGWILFFDEADALFGKRTEVKDAHDRFANQEVAYLLERIEDYNGLVILATNLKTNIDEAFMRRFNSIIPFPMPSSNERLLLWKKAFPQQVDLDQEVNLDYFAKNYKLNGSHIINIVQYCCLKTLERASYIITKKDIVSGIHKEFAKSNNQI